MSTLPEMKTAIDSYKRLGRITRKWLVCLSRYQEMLLNQFLAAIVGPKTKLIIISVLIVGQSCN